MRADYHSPAAVQVQLDAELYLLSVARERACDHQNKVEALQALKAELEQRQLGKLLRQ